MRMSVRRMQKEGMADSLHIIPFSSRFIFAATAADRSDLVELFNRYLALVPYSALESIGPPEGDFGLPPFFLEPRDRFELDAAELEWLQEHPLVRLGASPWEPLTIVDESNRYTGIAIETIRELLGRLGVFLIVEGDVDWDSVVELAKGRQDRWSGIHGASPRRGLPVHGTDPQCSGRRDQPFERSLLRVLG